MIQKDCIIDIGSICKALFEDDILYFREDGRLVRDEVISKIESLECEVAILDFSNIRAIDFSCSDEIVVALQEHNQWLNEKKIILKNLSRSHKENITSALEKKKLGVWVINDNNNEHELIGKIPKHLIEILELIKNKDTVTARQLADEVSEEITSISVKLGKLYKIGMLVRTEQKSSEGMQFLYKSLV